MITARLPKNRHELEIEIDGRPVPVDDVTVGFDGKRRYLLLKIFDFKLLQESTCPEAHRYERILLAFGDSAKMAALHPNCSMIELNPRACDGCPQRPI